MVVGNTSAIGEKLLTSRETKSFPFSMFFHPKNALIKKNLRKQKTATAHSPLLRCGYALAREGQPSWRRIGSTRLAGPPCPRPAPSSRVCPVIGPTRTPEWAARLDPRRPRPAPCSRAVAMASVARVVARDGQGACRVDPRRQLAGPRPGTPETLCPARAPRPPPSRPKPLHPVIWRGDSPQQSLEDSVLQLGVPSLPPPRQCPLSPQGRV